MESQIMLEQINSLNAEVFTAFNQIPYNLLSQEVEGSISGLLSELTEIQKLYNIYNNGSKFIVEGTNGDYVPAQLRYKLASSLVNKQARFLFAEAPDILVEPKGDVGKVTAQSKDALTVLNDLVGTVLDHNQFESMLIKAARDCFIGKRVAGMVNFNEEDGITITFLPALQFIYETKLGNQNVLTRFTAFMIVQDSVKNQDRKILRKRFTLEDDGYVWIQEDMFDGAGNLIEAVTPKQETLLNVIPANVFLNDGLSGDTKGESEIDLLNEFESWYSKLANADADAERKAMNSIRYTIDMDSNSTRNLKSGAGAYWDLQSDQNLDKANPSVGLLENSMSYSPALKTTLDRIKSVAFDQIDMPIVSLDTMSGTITTGKALKAIYWPLIVRCKEKMKTWGPGLANLVSIIIEGALTYPNTASMYISDTLLPVEYEIKIDQNHPLPEDEMEEKNIDLMEVAAQTMSRKAYMQKWRGLTNDQSNEELNQIALERQLLQDSAFTGLSDATVESIEGKLEWGSEEVDVENSGVAFNTAEN